MRKSLVAILLIVLILTALLAGCGSKTQKFTGTLDDWDVAKMSVTINGTSYRLAAGMEAFVAKAEKGKTYEFTRDKYGSIIGAVPK